VQAKKKQREDANIVVQTSYTRNVKAWTLLSDVPHVNGTGNNFQCGACQRHDVSTATAGANLDFSFLPFSSTLAHQHDKKGTPFSCLQSVI
jgi:hypothetical protein